MFKRIQKIFLTKNITKNLKKRTMLGINDSLTTIGFLAALYPTIWGFGQLFTGSLSDKYAKKNLLIMGMLTQALGILLIAYFSSFALIAIAAILLGIGTALVYPTFLAAIADYSHPQQRAECIGVYRLWRDLGYALGAIASGLIADVFGLQAAFIVIAVVTFAGGLQIAFRMKR